MIVDTHSHLYVEEFDADRAEAVQRALDAGVSRLILPNINLDSVEPMLDMCRRWPSVCTPLIGLHPEDVHEDWQSVLQQFHDLLLHADIPFAGIGEVGLDFYWDDTFRHEQIAAFEQQVQWSLDHRLPLSIHSRKAFNELYLSLRHFPGARGIFHCFSSSLEEAEKLLSLGDGFVLGIGGVVTYKNSRLSEVLPHIPLDRLVVETDCPYLSPVPHRGERNESAFVVHTLQRLADILGLPFQTVADATTANANRLFPPR